jgi:serine protease SohB
MDFITDYGLFVAKLATVLVFLLAVTFGLAFIRRKRGKAGQEEHLEVKRLNDKYDAMALALRAVMGPKRAFKQAHRAFKAERKARAKDDAGGDGSSTRKRVFVLRFQGDIRASAVAALREEVTAVLTVATPNDEVVVILDSPGGVVHGYGLAASQLQRFKDHRIALTVAVDKVAASGGYLMACVAQRTIAAPFAILGSIGVVGQMPNFNRLLKSHDVDYELITAGEYKRTLTMFGENTEKGRQKFREDIEITHALFKDFVRAHRKGLDRRALVRASSPGPQARRRGAHERRLSEGCQCHGRSVRADVHSKAAWIGADPFAGGVGRARVIREVGCATEEMPWLHRGCLPCLMSPTPRPCSKKKLLPAPTKRAPSWHRDSILLTLSLNRP